MIREAPFDRNGNMQSYPAPNGYPAWRTTMVETPPFEATMVVVGMETGRSAKRLILRDVNTGKTYPMFVADIVKWLEDMPLTATWEPCKRGQNYGIRKARA